MDVSWYTCSMRRNIIWLLLTLFILSGIVIAVFVVVSIIEPRFHSLETIRSLILYLPLILIVAVGQLMVIVTRNIDQVRVILFE